MKKTYDIIIFGASGFTGSLICEYLSNHSDNKKIKWAISGRDENKIKYLSKKYSVDMFIANSFNQESLNLISAQSKLIISTVGPYDIYGEKLVKACLKHQSHYLDLTGEPSFVKNIYNKYADIAKKRSIIMHCCGFESIPPDLGAYLTVKELNPSENKKNINLAYFLKTKGKISGGTWASFLNSITTQEPILEKTKSNRKSIKKQKLFYSNRFKKWALIFPVIDKYIVNKTSNSFKEYSDDFSFREYILLPSLISALSLISGIAFIGVIGRFKKIREKLLSLIPSGSGPTQKEREKHWFEVTIVGESEGSEVLTTISGGDPGYGETSKFIAEMALCILLETDSLIKRKGILTPVECTGDLMKARLEKAGIKINISNSK